MKRYLLTIITIIGLCVSTFANPDYRILGFKHLITVLQIQEDSLREGTNYFHIGNKTIHIDVKRNVVSNIGYVLFSDDIKAQANTSILNFLERYFLQLDYPQPNHTRLKMMQEDRFKFIHGNMSTIGTLLATDEFSFSYQLRNYEATWRRDGNIILCVTFPAEYQLISGEDKITAEVNFQNDVLATTFPKVDIIKEDLLTPTIQKDFYIKKGGAYLNDKLNSDLYYLKENGEFCLLSSISHPLESAANMMIGNDYGIQYNLKITQILYGFKKKIYDLPLRNWIAYCRNNGCTLYYGIESVNQQEIKATVIAVNTAENYNHLLFVNIPL